MKWREHPKDQSVIAVLGTITNEIGTIKGMITYKTDSNDNSWTNQNLLEGHDCFFIVPKDASNDLGMVDINSLEEDPLAGIIIFHRLTDQSLESIKRTIEREAKAAGFRPDD